MSGILYILICRNGRYYIGSTNDIDRRIKEHTTGYVKSTKNILPIELCFSKSFDSLKEARQVEYRLKALKRKDIIQRIIRENKIVFLGD